MPCRGYNGRKVLKRRVFGFALLLGAVLIAAAASYGFGMAASVKRVSPAFGDGEPLPARLAYGGEGGASGSLAVTEKTNDYAALGYGGPCPPPGSARRYSFPIYALDCSSLDLPPGATAPELIRAMEGAGLAEAEWMGTYRR